MKNTEVQYELTNVSRHRNRFVVVLGSSLLTREIVSSHRTAEAAVAASKRWKAPALVEVVDRETGCKITGVL